MASERGASLLLQSWLSKECVHRTSNRRNKSRATGPVDLQGAHEDRDAVVLHSVGIVLACEQNAKKLPAKFRKLTLV